MSASPSVSRCGKRRLMTMNPDFKEFLELLIERDVEFLLIGGVAYNYYAPPPCDQGHRHLGKTVN